jgi:hypothetical protein
MNQDPFATSQYIKKSLVFFLTLTAAVLGGFVAYTYINYEDTSLTDPLLLDQGLISLGDSDGDIPGGHLYVLATPVIPPGVELDTALFPQFMALSLADPTIRRILPTIPEAEQLVDPNRQYGLAILSIEEPDVPADEFHPGLVNYQTNELAPLATPPLFSETNLVAAPAATENRRWVAYSARTIPLDESFTDIDTWQIVLYDTATNDVRVIEGATNPVWLNGESDVLYLTTDGIYRYNLAANAAEPIDTNWNNLDTTAELAVADNSSAAIVTVPALNTIAVYRFSDPVNAVAELEGMIATPGVEYTNPTFSPGDTHYAVIREEFGDLTTRVEIRSIFERPVLDTIALDFNFGLPVRLSDWREEVEPIEWR